MKKLLVAMFVALLMVGCGEDSKKPGGYSPESNQSSAETPEAKIAQDDKIDLDDKETLEGIIAEAIDGNTLQEGGKEGEKLAYAPNQQTPFTGWVKSMWGNGQIASLRQYRDGQEDGLTKRWYKTGPKEMKITFKDGKYGGLWTSWYENGQKQSETTYKGGELNGLSTGWYENGQKKNEGSWKDGKQDGLWALWYENGQKREEVNYEDGKPWTGVAWKPNGEKCPETNLKDGNGVAVGYNDDGTELSRSNFKDGEYIPD